MVKASDNAFPSLLITEGTEPSAPAAGKQRLYIDSTTHLLKATNSSGTDRTIEGVAAGAITSSGLTQATARLLGRTTASTGAIEEITVGTGLSLSAGSLTATGGSGGELDYAQITSNANVTATTEATANTIITGASVAYSGSQIVIIEFFADGVQKGSTVIQIVVYDGASSIGRIGVSTTTSTVYGVRRITPSNASHTYSIRAFVDAGTGVIFAGAGGNGNTAPAFLRISAA